MTVALIAGILALAVVAATTDEDHLAGSRVAKMAAASAVVVLLVVVVGEWNAYSLLVLCALLLSWVGDLALSYSGRRPFVVGLIAFALAHVAYIAAFVARGGLSPFLFVLTGIVMVTFGIAVIRWLAPNRPPELTAPLVAYVAIICIMVATAFSTLGTDPNLLIPIAAVAFATSDLLVARQRFVTPARRNRLIGLPLYFTAQILFALSTS